MQFTATVLLPAADPAGFLPALTAALAPYNLNDYAFEPFDPSTGWDRWRLPERDVFPLRRWHRRDPSIIRVSPAGPQPPDASESSASASGSASASASALGARVLGRRGSVVAAPKRVVDFAAMRSASRRHAEGAWAAWAMVLRFSPGAQPRSHFDDLHEDPAEAQSAFLRQPAIQEVALAATTQRHPYFSFSVLLADPVVHFGTDRAAFVARAEAQALATHAYLTLDGQWLSQDTADRGWDTHVAAMTQYLDALPDDVVIARVACHS